MKQSKYTATPWTIYNNNPKPATTAPKTDEPARNPSAALNVGDAEALVPTDVTAAEGPADLVAVLVDSTLETIEDGAVRISVGIEEGLIVVGAMMMVLEAAAADESLLEPAAYSPMLRTEYAVFPPPV